MSSPRSPSRDAVFWSETRLTVVTFCALTVAPLEGCAVTVLVIVPASSS